MIITIGVDRYTPWGACVYRYYPEDGKDKAFYHRLGWGQDLSDLFWSIIATASDSYVSPGISEVLWLIDRGFDFRVRFTPKDIIRPQGLDEGVLIDVVITNPDHALLFKLTWGG